MNEPKTLRRRFTSANILEVEVGTNTPMGGDAGHGGKTIFRLKNLGGTAWTLKCLPNLLRHSSTPHEIENPEEIVIELYGDSEAETFIHALQFAFDVLEQQHALNLLTG